MKKGTSFSFSNMAPGREGLRPVKEKVKPLPLTNAEKCKKYRDELKLDPKRLEEAQLKKKAANKLYWRSLTEEKRELAKHMACLRKQASRKQQKEKSSLCQTPQTKKVPKPTKGLQTPPLTRQQQSVQSEKREKNRISQAIYWTQHKNFLCEEVIKMDESFESHIPPNNTHLFDEGIKVEKLNPGEDVDTDDNCYSPIQDLIKIDNSKETHDDIPVANVILEVNMETENSSKIQTSTAEIKVEVEENLPIEYSHRTRVDVKSENEIMAKANYVKHKEGSSNVNNDNSSSTMSCDESILLDDPGSQCMAAFLKSRKGLHILNGSDVSLNQEPQIEIDVDEASESYWKLPTYSNNSIHEEGLTPSAINPAYQKISSKNSDSHKNTNTGSSHAGRKTFDCLTCGKVFSYRHHLQDHNRTHAGEKSYECELCAKGFSQKSHTERHKRSHTRERPFECVTCRKAFTNCQNLQNHNRTHTRKKPYKCLMCRKAFICYKSLQYYNKPSGDGYIPSIPSLLPQKFYNFICQRNSL